MEVKITPMQASQLEALWRICSGNKRKVDGDFLKRWECGFAELTGIDPRGVQELKIITGA